MIKLTNIDDNVIYINPNYIESIYSFRYNDKTIATKVFCVGPDTAYYTVKETPEQILSLMNDIPLKSLAEELLELKREVFVGYEAPFYNADDVWKIVNKYIPEEDDD